MTTTNTPPALLNLSDLSGRIDIQGFYESHGIAISGKPVQSRNDGTEWAGSCPRCPGSTDRFHFWQNGRFSCSLRSSGCGWHGSSPYYFLRDEGMSHQEALEELGIDPDEVDSYSPGKSLPLPLFLTSDEPPNKKWQEAAHAFCQFMEHVLWSNKGESARAYLHSRGFKDETIKWAHLGLCPDWYIKPLEDWGLDPVQLSKEDDPQIKIPKGITLPWYVGNDIWKIQIRRPEPGLDGKYYKEVTGGSDLLYNVDSIQPGQPVMLVESELDALSVVQEAGDLLAVVATGGSGKALSGRPIARLNQASFLLQSFDDDEPGEQGAQSWLEAFGNSERWTPQAHDCNDMLKSEPGSIRKWVEMALHMIAVQGEPETLEEFWESCQPPALDKAGKEIPAELLKSIPNLIERVLAFQDGALAGRKMCCDTLDWEIDHDGLLICPCVTKAREEGKMIDARIAQEKAAKRSPVLSMDW